MASTSNGIEITIKTTSLRLKPSESLGITGSCPELGNWAKAVLMNGDGAAFSSATVTVSEPFEYKFVIADKATGAILSWEDCWNRRADLSSTKIIVPLAHLNAPGWRGAGTAVPVFSLRSEESFGIGEFHDLKKMVDWAVLTGQKIIQLLPVNDTTMTGKWQDSYPYNANSTFALHPQFLHLPDAGVPEDEEYLKIKDELNALDTVDYERVNNEKTRLLRKAFKGAWRRTVTTKAYKAFISANGYWLLPYAAFRLLTDLKGTPDFTQWGEYSKCSEELIDSLRAEYKTEIDFHCFEQYHLYRQFAEVKAYAHAHGVMLKGDLPIGISPTSCDAWLNPTLFNLDASAGAPPDAFSAQGQNWGFPTYNWERMSEDGYAWWKARLGKMAECFDAFRIDHILGFFRIWEIPTTAVHGLLGHFNPALPYSALELSQMGFNVEGGRYVTPPTNAETIYEFFGDKAQEVLSGCIENGRLKPFCSTQRQVEREFAGEENRRVREGLMNLIDDVLFVEDPRRKGMFHPRIGAQNTFTYRQLDQWHKDAYNRMYNDFFYRRHNWFWKESAMKKLPALLAATDMLACGEDLGMIPDCVPEVMRELQILSLEIETMPKDPHRTFAYVAAYPYLSVCTTSTHDMNPLRAWWEEDRGLSSKYYHEVLCRGDDAPYFCEPWICAQVVRNHLNSPSMLAVLPLADWLSTDGGIRRENPNEERINVPAIPRYYWRYRMHITLEKLLEADDFNASLRDMIANSGR